MVASTYIVISLYTCCFSSLLNFYMCHITLLLFFPPTVIAAKSFFACMFFLLHDIFWPMLLTNLTYLKAELHFFLPQH